MKNQKTNKSSIQNRFGNGLSIDKSQSMYDEQINIRNLAYQKSSIKKVQSANQIEEDSFNFQKKSIMRDRSPKQFRMKNTSMKVPSMGGLHEENMNQKFKKMSNQSFQPPQEMDLDMATRSQSVFGGCLAVCFSNNNNSIQKGKQPPPIKIMDPEKKHELEKLRDMKRARLSSNDRSRSSRRSCSLHRNMPPPIAIEMQDQRKFETESQSPLTIKGDSFRQIDSFKYNSLNFRQFYRVNQTLGEGAESVVHKCTRLQKNTQFNEDQEQNYAIKEINWNEYYSSNVKQMSKASEIIKSNIMYQLYTSLDHPLIFPIQEVFIDDYQMWIVSPFYSGGEFSDLLFRDDISDLNELEEKEAAPLAEDQLKPFIWQLLRALNYLAKSNIAHRDLKLENIILESYLRDLSVETKPFIKLIDFGFDTRQILDNDFTDEDIKANIPGVGTLNYMPPEVLEDGIKYNSASKGCTSAQDIWSLGVIMFNTLCSEFPFDDTNEKKLKIKIQSTDYNFDNKHWNNVSDEAKDLIEQLLNPFSAQRITAEKALQHPWLQSMQINSQKAVKKISDEIKMLMREDLQRLKNYRRTTDFFHICKIIYETCLVDFVDQHKSREVFLAINQSDSGQITAHELQTAFPELTAAETESIMTNVCYGQQTNSNIKAQDRGITWTEFLVATSDVQHPDQIQNMSNDEKPENVAESDSDDDIQLPMNMQERNYFIREVYNFLNVKYRPFDAQSYLTADTIFHTMMLQSHKFSFLLGRPSNKVNLLGKREPSIKREMKNCIYYALQLDNEREWFEMEINFNKFQLFLLSPFDCEECTMSEKQQVETCFASSQQIMT